MKPNRLLFGLSAAVFFFLPCALQAQKNVAIAFKTGAIIPEANVRQSYLDTFQNKLAKYKNKAFIVLQFEKKPEAADYQALASAGIQLQDAIPGNAYTATVSGKLEAALLQKAAVRSVVELLPRQKMDAFFSTGRVPSWAVKEVGKVEVLVSFPKSFLLADVLSGLSSMRAQVLDVSLQAYRVLRLRIPQNELENLAAQPFIEFVQAAPPGDQPLNYNSRAASRANVLSATVANGGKGLKGEGVVVGIGDNADIQTHVDFAGRLINRAAATAAGHGSHVSGTVAGAGNLNELFMGYAPKATIVSQTFSHIISNASTYVQDYGMVITNNSYGDIIECEYNGTYDLTSRALDQMAFDLPALTNVFAAGNSGADVCPPFSNGYRTVLGGYQSAKNVITVGATTDSGAIASFSSRGPVRDGRLKPDITAMGQGVYSTWPTNIYIPNQGTSMSSPAVSGGLALLYQRYRQLNGGSNPKNALMKALICNGSVDKGNVGPDFQYGFGWMNLLRCIDMLENNRYFNANVAQGSTNNHSITVPANTAQLKVLLYWNDPAASPFSSRTLVNDLDVQVVSSTSGTTLPRILDTTVAGVGNAATTGVDKWNNIEQVVIDAPAAGTYTIKVIGSGVVQNATQNYVVVYDPVPVQLKLTSPAGGEGLAPSTSGIDMVKIAWEAYGFSSGTATLEFSADGGTTWSVIASNVDVNRTLYSWWVPNVTTDKALIRLTKNGTGESSTTPPFTIIGQPTLSLAPVQCEGYINLSWTAAPGTTDYEVLQLKGEEMRTVATTTATTYTFAGLSKDTTYWVTVRARINGKGGRRAVAVQRMPNSGTCAGNISDNDLALDAIVAPQSGRKATSTALGNNSVITVRIKNRDDAPVSNFMVSYWINGGPAITENVAATIAAGATYTHTFAATADLSAAGVYNLVAVVKAAGDVVTANDTAYKVVKQIDNTPLNLATTFIDNLDVAQLATYQKDTIGLGGIERYDFSTSSPFGRARTFINTGIAYSSTKAVTLDADRFVPGGVTNYLYGTYNLSSYNLVTNDVRLDFQFLNHGLEPNGANRLWVRGSDSQPWIEAFNLDSIIAERGIYKRTPSIEIADVVMNAGQNFTSSFQLRWGQWGRLPATDKETGSGYTLDDIRLYLVQNDLQMKSIDAPLLLNCGLGTATPVTVSVRNSANTTLTNIPVKYRVNGGGAWVSETIASIAGNATVQYTFNTPANFSNAGSHTIQTLVDFSTDSFRENDTATTVIHNQPVVSTFPYLQNFENGDGFWFPSGNKSSWAWGTPASDRINKAASGTKAWKTSLKGHYNDGEQSYLYSPCFDVSTLVKPTLSFSVALDIEDCGNTLCDAAWVEYSADGITWTKLGTAGTGTNWYNKTSSQVWSTQTYSYWHVATVALPTGFNRLRLRFAFAADEGVSRDGIAVDDIHVYDNTKGIYDGVTLAAPVSQTISGNNWVDINSGGKLIASVHPQGQSLGATDVQAFIFSGAVRNNNSQYYHNRNLTIKPANSVTDSVAIRFYFLDVETDSLLKAGSCATCSKPASAYELGISKYSDPDKSFENGTVSDNQQGMWQFLKNSEVAIVPFDKGYYAEFKVKDFSEFWLNNGGFDKSTPLPVKMMEFAAQKSGNNVLLTWKVGSETAVLRYEIELAKGNAQLQAGQFQKIGEVASIGNATSVRTYRFTDAEGDKFGVRYYRLKVINSDGSFLYSPVRSILFNDAQLWQVYPNPSSGIFYLIYQGTNGQRITASVYDSKGSLVHSAQVSATGFPQKLVIDVTGNASGVYLLQVTGEEKKSFKLYKQ